MNLYLIRHGLVDYNTAQLNEDGKKFSRSLPNLITERLKLVISDEEKRCVETISGLATKNGVKVETFSKAQFQNLEALTRAKGDLPAAICYRIETVNPLLASLGLPQFTQANRDTAYSFIYKVSINGNAVSSTKINTGFKKA